MIQVLALAMSRALRRTTQIASGGSENDDGVSLCEEDGFQCLHSPNLIGNATVGMVKAPFELPVQTISSSYSSQFGFQNAALKIGPLLLL